MKRWQAEEQAIENGKKIRHEGWASKNSLGNFRWYLFWNLKNKTYVMPDGTPYEKLLTAVDGWEIYEEEYSPSEELKKKEPLIKAIGKCANETLKEAVKQPCEEEKQGCPECKFNEDCLFKGNSFACKGPLLLKQPCEHEWDKQPGTIERCGKCARIRLYKPPNGCDLGCIPDASTGNCLRCGKPYKPSPKLPEKIEEDVKYLTTETRRINQLIDYLKEKENG